MKLNKYYSLDECTKDDKIFKHLNNLQDDLKIEYEIVDIDIIKIIDNGLTISEIKKIISLFNEYDVIEYTDYDDDDEIDSEEEYDDYY